MNILTEGTTTETNKQKGYKTFWQLHTHLINLLKTVRESGKTETERDIKRKRELRRDAGNTVVPLHSNCSVMEHFSPTTDIVEKILFWCLSTCSTLDHPTKTYKRRHAHPLISCYTHTHKKRLSRYPRSFLVLKVNKRGKQQKQKLN